MQRRLIQHAKGEASLTIAMCYLSPEGIVLGADSTASFTHPDGSFHYFNHAQKLFRVGETGSVGVLTWGLGGLSGISYRTLIAELADDLEATPPANMLDVADRWAGRFWAAYSDRLSSAIKRCKDLGAKSAPTPGLVVGFCIAGAVLPSRATSAYEVVFEPLADEPTPKAVSGSPMWGAPNMIQRLMAGYDPKLRGALISSGKWSGSEPELDNLLGQHRLSHAILPIREAIDFVHTCIYSTIKALKFSSLKQICGGPIEIAVITTDRQFRWVKHKAFDAAITEGDRS